MREFRGQGCVVLLAVAEKRLVLWKVEKRLLASAPSARTDNADAFERVHVDSGNAFQLDDRQMPLSFMEADFQR
jgi:hypothetical protein